MPAGDEKIVSECVHPLVTHDVRFTDPGEIRCRKLQNNSKLNGKETITKSPKNGRSLIQSFQHMNP